MLTICLKTRIRCHGYDLTLLSEGPTRIHHSVNKFIISHSVVLLKIKSRVTIQTRLLFCKNNGDRLSIIRFINFSKKLSFLKIVRLIRQDMLNLCLNGVLCHYISHFKKLFFMCIYAKFNVDLGTAVCFPRLFCVLKLFF